MWTLIRRTSRDRLNTLEFDRSLCVGCGLCTIVCPHGVFALDEGAVRLARAEACIECGACQRNCPTGAIHVDAGVGCAQAMINAILRGSDTPTCGPDGCCGGSSSDCC